MTPLVIVMPPLSVTPTPMRVDAPWWAFLATMRGASE